MQFVFHAEAGAQSLVLEGESFTHIFSVRRSRATHNLALRNLRDDRLYTYKVESISKRYAGLRLESSQIAPNAPRKHTHIIWAITQSKTIEKSLPSLNELGLSKLSLFWADFSQRGQSIDEERVRRILISSCEQCGRGDLCEVEILADTQSALEKYPRALVLDFGGKIISSGLGDGAGIKLDSGVLIGAEGGFSQRERELFAGREIVAFDTGLILRSQTAALTLLAKAL